MNREDLKSMWSKLVIKFTNNIALINETYDIIENLHNNPSRYYHNLNHIGYMLSEAEKFKMLITDYDSVLLAIWFHDIIYDPKKLDNEEASAILCENFLKKINLKEANIIKIKCMILKTKNHSKIGSYDDFDTKVFLDLDLSILGVNPKNYMEYAENIRKEYFFVPYTIYRDERIKILENFLNQDSIFKTERMIEIYETQARENIISEIQLLMKQLNYDFS